MAWSDPGAITAADATSDTDTAHAAYITRFGQASQSCPLFANYYDGPDGIPPALAAIPADATITGVTVRASLWCPAGSAQASLARLMPGGTEAGGNKAIPAVPLPSGRGTVTTFGGDADLWGIPLTPADFDLTPQQGRQALFAVELAVTPAASGTDVYADWVTLEVSYT